MTQFDARDLNLKIDSSALKPLFKTSPHRHASAMFFDWLIIVATTILCVQYFNLLFYLVAILIIGARMHALAILMHDATHYRFLKDRKWNDLITNILTMYPLFTSIEKYRQNHLAHHQHLNTEHDPDWVAKLTKREFIFPKTKAEFLWTVLSYLTFVQGIRDAIWFFKRFGSSKGKNGQQLGYPQHQLLFYALLFTILTISGAWSYYILFWILPYLSTFFMYQYIRSVAEHFGELSYDHLLTSTRSVKAYWLERFLIAPHQIGYHLEHHLYPGVPFYHLPELHKLLMSDVDYHNKAHITQGYFSGLLDELGKSGLTAEAN